MVGKFVEFFGPGVAELSIADRATIANMCPEYGATVGFFPVDQNSLGYLRQTSRFPSSMFVLPSQIFKGIISVSKILWAKEVFVLVGVGVSVS